MLAAWGAPPGGHVGQGERLALAATDSGAGRTITLSPDGPVFHRSVDAGAELCLVGTASDLTLQVFNRPPLGTVEARGDGGALERWYREFAF